MKGSSFRNALLLAAAALMCAPVGAQEVTTGSIAGTVYDNTGGVLPGAMVTIASSSGSKSSTADANGAFRFLYLTPGNYDLQASMHGFSTVEQKNIGVRLGGRSRIEITLAPGTSETIEVTAAAPVVNLNTTTTGANIGEELMSSIPLGRNFASTLTLAPGVVESGVDSSNPSIGGASGLENSYMVDGVNIGNTGYGSAGSYSIVFGALGSGVTLDYIQEVQVKTGGYEPEFGEALGGVVNLITKSGGNDFKGSLYTYLRPNALEGNRELLTRSTATVDTIESDGYDFGLEGGGPLAEDQAFFYGAFNPQFTTDKRRTSLAIRNSGQGIDHTADRERTIWNYAANIKVFPTPKHSLGVSAFGDPSKGDQGPQRASSYAVLDNESRFSELTYGGHNVSGRWDGELANNWFIEGQVAWHKDKFEESLSSNTPNGADRRVDPWIQFGGVGFFGNSESQNAQYRLKFSNFFDMGGEHNLRYGIDVQDISYDNTANYSGPSGLILPDGTAATSGYTWYIHPGGTQFRVPRVRSSSLTSETSAMYTSFFVSDSWNIGETLNVMAGIRYEQNSLKGNLPVELVTFDSALNELSRTQGDSLDYDNNWGPRFSATWDPTADNKTKISFAWGRFFGKVPNDLAVRALSQETTHFVIYPIDEVDFSNPEMPRFLNPAGATTFITFGDHAADIDTDSKVTYQDEFVFGAEREVMPFFNLGASFIYRDLGRTLEDVATVPYSALVNGTADFGNYFITNPTPEAGFPDPARTYKAFTVKADKRMHDRWQMLASYTWSELDGNYEGYFRRDNGQSDPFITSLFDFPYLADPSIWANVINAGVLPNDRTHVFNLYGSYMLQNDLNFGMGLRVQSGVPLTRLGWNEAYGNGFEIPLEARGASGRGDTTSVFDLHADYPLRFGGGQALHLSFDVFNVFNQQKGNDFWMSAEDGGTVNPDPSLDLDACPNCVDADFGQVLTYQTPREMRFALRWSFGR